MEHRNQATSGSSPWPIALLTFGEMLKQASHGTVTQAYSGPIALRDKLAHVPHRRLNAEVLAISVEQATDEILPLIQARIQDLSNTSA